MKRKGRKEGQKKTRKKSRQKGVFILAVLIGIGIGIGALFLFRQERVNVFKPEVTETDRCQKSRKEECHPLFFG